MEQTLEHRAEVKNGIRRAVFVALAILIELIWLYVQLGILSRHFSWIPGLVRVAALFLVLGIYGRHMNAAAKMPWIMLISAAPLFGVPLYLMLGLPGSTERMRERYRRIDARIFPQLTQKDEDLRTLMRRDVGVANQFRYLRDYAGYPLCRNTDIQYYRSAAEALEAQLEAIRGARRFIFLEYHAIEERQAFSRLHAALRERAAAGVEVRLFYDDVGSLVFIDHDFIERMQADGIRCRVFNPVLPVLSLFMNHRDHRKITVIDGELGFTGGYNLADEYFNLTHPYGHWYDTGVRLKGDAVRNLTAIFLENWNAIRGDDLDDREPGRYLTAPAYQAKEQGWCLPYADSPLGEERTGENVYMNILNNAKRYVWFTTPYLIITDELSRAMTLAAKRGVDVRIVTPGIPDKKLVYQTTRSYYNGLARWGVRLFEYTPGFCHAKQCVSDDSIAVCGTINLDYRSLYHHFENAVLFYDCAAVTDMKQEFEQLFPRCREVTEHYLSGRSHVLRIGHCLLRLIAPLL